jgi:hypothetical protein
MERGDYLDEVRLVEPAFAQIQHGRKGLLHQLLAFAAIYGGRLLHLYTPQRGLGSPNIFLLNFSAALVFGQSSICTHFYRAHRVFTRQLDL